MVFQRAYKLKQVFRHVWHSVEAASYEGYSTTANGSSFKSYELQSWAISTVGSVDSASVLQQTGDDHHHRLARTWPNTSSSPCTNSTSLVTPESCAQQTHPAMWRYTEFCCDSGIPRSFQPYICRLELSGFGMDTRLTRFNSKLSELRNTLLAAPEMVPAMSRAASIFLRVMKAGFSWMASPISRAEVASPCALMMALCLSCSALSTCMRTLSVRIVC